MPDSLSIRSGRKGGFNHHTVANYLASNPPKTADKDTLGRFEALFAAANGLFKSEEEEEERETGTS
jgi:hypothetical protein